MRQLRQQAPGIVIDVVASDALSDLRLREADIAVRHLRPDQPGRSLCIKAALPRLKVAGDWQAPVARNAHEWWWISVPGPEARRWPWAR